LQNYVSEVTWCNELVVNPTVCICNPRDYYACRFIKHVVQDACGIPVIDQTLHWANPARECEDDIARTDCNGKAQSDPALAYDENQISLGTHWCVQIRLIKPFNQK